MSSLLGSVVIAVCYFSELIFISHLCDHSHGKEVLKYFSFDSCETFPLEICRCFPLSQLGNQHCNIIAFVVHQEPRLAPPKK